MNKLQKCIAKAFKIKTTHFVNQTIKVEGAHTADIKKIFATFEHPHFQPFDERMIKFRLENILLEEIIKSGLIEYEETETSEKKRVTATLSLYRGK